VLLPNAVMAPSERAIPGSFDAFRTELPAGTRNGHSLPMRNGARSRDAAVAIGETIPIAADEPASMPTSRLAPYVRADTGQWPEPDPLFSPAQPPPSRPVYGSAQPPAASEPVYGSARPLASEPVYGSPAPPAVSEPVYGSPAHPAVSEPAYGSAQPAAPEPVFGSAQPSAPEPGLLPRRQPTFGSSGPPWEAATAPASAEDPTASGGNSMLPRRQRQASLAPQLRTDRPAVEDGMSDDSDGLNPATSRALAESLQHGLDLARAAPPAPDDPWPASGSWPQDAWPSPEDQ
jgi:hypothetical protein